MKAIALPRALAREIDRLAWRAHAFHRFAHHPLCDRYRGEVLRIGKRGWLCKGCACVVAGLTVGAGLGALWPPAPPAGLVALAAALVLGALSLRWRLPKLLGRLLPALGLGWAPWAGWLCLSLALANFAACFLLYRRRGGERLRCRPCPERDLNPCSGFASIVRRERAFQRKANALVDRHRRGLSSWASRR